METSRHPVRNDDVGLRAKVEFLLRPESYPERPQKVEAKETHMSWVFLTDRHAYKLKKPVRFSYLDYGTIELRRHYCEEEVRLNRRLAPDVYLDTVSIALDAAGSLSIGGGGRVIDWLVKMRRLPAERTLEHAIEAGTVGEADVLRVASTLAAFYRSAPRVSMEPAVYRQRFERDIDASRRELLRPGFALSKEPIEEISLSLRRFLAAREELLAQRVLLGRIVEGHGDLRPEHVYLCEYPLITDCLEFNRDFRLVDPADEIAYLAMECERGGAARVGVWLFEAYADAANDDPPAPIVEFYKGFRALLRAKIAIWHLDEPRTPAPDKWRARANAYLDLAKIHSYDAR
jgi:aminoglycoside phosphotransferase family enzyme